MKVIIVANGKPPAQELVTREITADTKIIAADGGANCLHRYKVLPDYLIGDLDSVKLKVLTSLRKQEVMIESYPCDKDFTDSELALKKALTLKPQQIVFLGCLGGSRVDHLLGSLGLLLTCANLNINASLKDAVQSVYLLTKTTTIHGVSGELFSLQAYGGVVRDLTISGAKYALQNYQLKVGDQLTLSNEFKREQVMIKFKSGNLILVRSNNN